MTSIRHLLTVCATAAFLAVAVSACESTTHAEEGQVIGAVLGGVLGSQIGEGRGRTAAIIVGAIAGGMIGRHIGQTMDDNDRRRTAQAFNNNRTGESTVWTNPDTGHQYVVTPVRTYDRGTGPCREFKLDATVDGSRDRDVYGTACLQADGSWVVQ